MAKINKKPEKIYTAEGGIAKRVNPEMQLRRSIMACMLWEDSFYESGESIGNRISKLCQIVNNETIANFAIKARNKQKLRHVPLLLCVELLRKRYDKTAKVIAEVIQRPDELTELLAIYWKDGRCPLSAQLKKGLAKSFVKFNEYQLAKYNRDAKIKLRDVLFLSHAKPKDQEQADLWKRLVDKTLQIPDTWEVNLSTGKDKKETWERLIKENKLGGLAFLRNLRNMQDAGLSREIIQQGLSQINISRVLPFRFISAAKYALRLEAELEVKMYECIQNKPQLKGKTILIVDASGSMYHSGNVSKKSDLSRIDAAAALAILIREICEEPIIYATAGDDYKRIHATMELPPRRGFALKDLICNQSLMNKIGGGGIFLKQVMDFVYEKEKTADRIIVITDEQDCSVGSEDSPLKAKVFGKNNYLINISIEKNGIGYDKWIHIDGWSEAIVDYIMEFENSNLN